MLGVIIGVTAVILLVSIGEGARKMISDEFSGLGTNILALFPGKTSREGGMHMGASTVRKIVYDDAGIIERRSPHVRHAVPVMMGTAWVKYLGKTRDTYVVGVTEPYFDIRNLVIDVGHRITEADNDARRRVCVLGRTVKHDIFGDKNPLGEIVTVGDGKYRVVGIMKKKGVALGFDIDDLVFIPISAARELFDTDALFNVTIKVTSEADAALAKRDIMQIMKRRHANREDFTVLSQDEMMAAMGKVLNILTGVLAGIAAISLIVGGIGIMNVMLISIKERTREIGIRKAVGARDRDILMQFLIESVLLSMIGGMGGIVLSLSIALFLMAFVEAVPIKLTFWSMALAFLFSAMVGVFFGVYPAKKAAQSDPIVALRYE
jgi:putative ABC transport system permease protein